MFHDFRGFGQATVIASEFPDPGSTPGGSRKHIRDSEGLPRPLRRPRAGTKRKREADPAPSPSTGPSPSIGALSVQRVRGRPGGMGAFTPGAAAWHQRRAAAGRREADRAGLAQEALVARCLASLTLAPSVQPPAADRFAALRARVRAKQAAQAGTGSQEVA